MTKTNIEWADESWNPIVGCSIASHGCNNCYAMAMAHRIAAMAEGSGKQSHYAGLTHKADRKGAKSGLR